VNLQAGDNTTITIDDYYVALQPITKTNSNIDIVLVDQANPTQPNKPKKYLQIFGKQSGTTSITLKDAEGTMVVVNVTVSGSGNGGNVPKFESFFLLNNPDDINLKNIIAFNIKGSHGEVGIELKNENGIYTRQKMEKNEKGFYIFQLDSTVCSTC
jgi:hypothetical protein